MRPTATPPSTPPHQRAPRRTALALILALLLPTSAALAASPTLREQARALATLRQEIERLAADALTTRQRQRQEAATLRARADDARARIDRERAQIKLLRRALADRRATTARVAQTRAAQTTALLNALDLLKTRVTQSLPYRRDARLDAIAALRRDLSLGVLSPEAAITQTWRLVDDELRLGADLARDQQPITLGTERTLATVIRLGMVALFVKTQDGRLGIAYPGDTAATPVTDPAHIQALNALFDGVARGQLQQVYALPLPPPAPRSPAELRQGGE